MGKSVRFSVRNHIKFCDRPIQNSRLSGISAIAIIPNRAFKTSSKSNKNPAKQAPNLLLKIFSKKKRARGNEFPRALSGQNSATMGLFSAGQAHGV